MEKWRDNAINGRWMNGFADRDINRWMDLEIDR